jgi:uncharacterized membrane protein YgdD (TMEM256/DUF423 family)
MKTIRILAPLLLALAVITGAFGAHALENLLSVERMVTWQTAVFYHFVTALGLLVITNVNVQGAQKWLFRGAVCLLIGVSIFSDSLYLLCLTDIKWLGAITPIGGLFMIIGWGLVAFAFYKENKEGTDSETN